MTAEELQAQISAMRDSIQAQQERLDELEKQLESADEFDNIDKPLKIGRDEEVYCVTMHGTIYRVDSINDPLYQKANNCHRLFKSENYARMFREKTQFIADLLHFKWLYDRDFYPENNFPGAQWTIMLDDDHKFAVTTNWNAQPGDIYFSTKELAQKCADWLNRKAGKI